MNIAQKKQQFFLANSQFSNFDFNFFPPGKFQKPQHTDNYSNTGGVTEERSHVGREGKSQNDYKQCEKNDGFDGEFALRFRYESFRNTIGNVRTFCASHF